MQNKIKYLSFLLLLSSVCFASEQTYKDLFNTPATDMSLEFLRVIFGNVGTVLVGGSTVIVGKMFDIFNTGVLAFVGLIIFYTMSMGVISTAQDGQAFGQKMSSWSMIRVVAGTSLLIPQASGYSSIQILVMWSVVQGIGFADTILNTGLDTMKTYGGTVVVPEADPSVKYGEILKLAVGSTDSSGTQGFNQTQGTEAYGSNIFASAMCSRYLYYRCMQGEDATSSGCSTKWGYRQTQSFDNVNQYTQWSFGDKDDGPERCGTFQSPTGDEIVALALNDMVNTIVPAAYSIFDTLVSACKSNDSNCSIDGITGYNSDTSPVQQGCQSPGYNDTYSCGPSNVILAGASLYYADILPARMNTGDTYSKAGTSWMDDAKKYGWAMMGSYYRNLLGGNSGITADNSSSVTLKDLDATFIPNIITAYNSSVISSLYNDSYTDQAFTKVYKSIEQTSASFSTHSDSNRNAMYFYQNSAATWSAELKETYIFQADLDNMELNTSSTSEIYDKFTAYMLQTMINGYKGTSFNADSPFKTFGDSGYFGYEDYGKFVTFPIYVWSLLTVSLATFAGIDLYGTNPSAGDLFSPGMDKPRSPNAKCQNVGKTCSVSGSPDFSGCFYQAYRSKCINRYGLGILGNAAAKQDSVLVDPLLSISSSGQRILKYSSKYFIKTATELFSKMTSLSGAYTAANLVTGLSFGAVAFAANLAGGGIDFSGPIGMIASSIQSVALFNFEVDKIKMEAFLPIGSAIASIFFVLGIVLGIYLPFIPFLLFLFGVIGWIIQVIESMVAAPLVAMGMTHPEGHDLLGKAEQAIILTLGVFIRPACMVIGLFLAVSLLYIAMGYFNLGFISVLNPLLADIVSTNKNVNSFQIISVAVSLLVYAYVISEVVNQCFGMIYQVPDRVLRWIGGQADQSTAAQAVAQVKGQVSQAGQGAAQGASQKASSAPQVSAQQGPQVQGPKKDSASADSG